MGNERILIVEDERAVARGLEYGLKSEGFVVLWTDTGKKGLQLAETESPHLILLDIRLPDMSGFDVCRHLRSQGHRQPILMLTARDEELDKILGLEMGADDYIVKPYSLRELISRIRAQLRRAYGDLAMNAGTQRYRFGQVEIDLNRLQVSKQNKPIDLTATELRLLRYLVSHPDRPCSRDEIIEAVWGYSSDIGNDRTIDVHIRHLREKLEEDPATPRWLITVRGLGYKFQS